MKKKPNTKLPLRIETVRRLDELAVFAIAAGASGSRTNACDSGEYTCGLTENSEGSWC